MKSGNSREMFYSKLMDDGCRLYDQKGQWVVVILMNSTGAGYTMLPTNNSLLQ